MNQILSKICVLIALWLVVAAIVWFCHGQTQYNLAVQRRQVAGEQVSASVKEVLERNGKSHLDGALKSFGTEDLSIKSMEFRLGPKTKPIAMFGKHDDTPTRMSVQTTLFSRSPGNASVPGNWRFTFVRSPVTQAWTRCMRDWAGYLIRLCD